MEMEKLVKLVLELLLDKTHWHYIKHKPNIFQQPLNPSSCVMMHWTWDFLVISPLSITASVTQRQWNWHTWGAHMLPPFEVQVYVDFKFQSTN